MNPVMHYRLDVGLLRVGDPADFILVDDLRSFRVRETWIDGQCVAREGRTHIEQIQIPQGSIVNRFDCRPVTAKDLRVSVDVSEWNLPVIEARDASSIYDVPLLMQAEELDTVVLDKLGLSKKQSPKLQS